MLCFPPPLFLSRLKTARSICEFCLKLGINPWEGVEFSTFKKPVGISSDLSTLRLFGVILIQVVHVSRYLDSGPVWELDYFISILNVKRIAGQHVACLWCRLYISYQQMLRKDYVLYKNVPWVLYLTKVSAGCSAPSTAAHFSTESNFKDQNSDWAAFELEILTFTPVSVRSHITLLVAMVTDHTSSPPPPSQIALPVRDIGFTGGLCRRSFYFTYRDLLPRDRGGDSSASWTKSLSAMLCHVTVSNHCSCMRKFTRQKTWWGVSIAWVLSHYFLEGIHWKWERKQADWSY